MKNEIFERLWESMRECETNIWLIKLQMCQDSSKSKIFRSFAPLNPIGGEAMHKVRHSKNVRFGSGFLHVVLKLIYQQDYYVSTKLAKFMREISSKSAFSRPVDMACLSKSARLEDIKY